MFFVTFVVFLPQPYNRSTVRVRPRSVMLITIAMAVVVFLIVQDRVTAAGARRYVAQQRDARATSRVAPTIDQVMAPAIHRSVQQGALWSGLVLVAGCSCAAVLSRRELEGMRG